MESIPLIDRRQHGFSGSKNSQIPVGKQKRGLPRPQGAGVLLPARFDCPSVWSAASITGAACPPCGYCPAVGRPARTAEATAAPGAVRRRAPAGGNRRRGFAERGGVLLRPRGWRRQGRLHRAVQFYCAKKRFCSRKTAFFLKIPPCFCPPLTRTGPLPRTGTASSCGRGSGSAWPRNSSYCPPPYTTTPP